MPWSKNTEMKIPGPGKVELVYTAEDGTEVRELVHNYAGAGVAQGMHNICGSIESFAKSCFNYALDTKQDLWFATKDTISKKYDHTFKDIFQEIFDEEYKENWGISSENKVKVGCIANVFRPGSANQISIRLDDWISEESINESFVIKKFYDFIVDILPSSL